MLCLTVSSDKSMNKDDDEIIKNTSLVIDLYNKIKNREDIKSFSKKFRKTYYIDPSEINEKCDNVISAHHDHIGGVVLEDFIVQSSIFNGNYQIIEEYNNIFRVDIDIVVEFIVDQKLNKDMIKAFIIFFDHHKDDSDKKFIKNMIGRLNGSEESIELFKCFANFVEEIHPDNLIYYPRYLKFAEEMLNEDEKIRRRFRILMIKPRFYKELLFLTDVNFVNKDNMSIFMIQFFYGNIQNIKYLMENYDVRLIIEKYHMTTFVKISVESLELISSLENFHDFIEINKQLLMRYANEKLKRYIENI